MLSQEKGDQYIFSHAMNYISDKGVGLVINNQLQHTIDRSHRTI